MASYLHALLKFKSSLIPWRPTKHLIYEVFFLPNTGYEQAHNCSLRLITFASEILNVKASKTLQGTRSQAPSPARPTEHLNYEVFFCPGSVMRVRTQPLLSGKFLRILDSYNFSFCPDMYCL